MSEANLLTVTWLLGAVLFEAYALAIYIQFIEKCDTCVYQKGKTCMHCENFDMYKGY